jgi:hypothetical protein
VLVADRNDEDYKLVFVRAMGPIRVESLSRYLELTAGLMIAVLTKVEPDRQAQE